MSFSPLEMGCNAILAIAEIGGSKAQGRRSGRGITQAAQADAFSGAEAWGNPVGGEALPLRDAGAEPPRSPFRPVSGIAVEDCYWSCGDLLHFQSDVS